MPRHILIAGASGHGQVVADILLAGCRAGLCDVPIGFVDDDETLHGAALLGLPIYGPLALRSSVAHDGIIVAVGDNGTRRRVLAALREQDASIVNAVHPSAVIAPGVRLGVGITICAGVIVNTGCTIEDGAILNTGCTVDHHSHIGRYAHIAPGVHLAGHVTVGEGALLGIGSSVNPECSIGDWAIVGAGAAAITDIPAHCTAVGVPARVIKQARD